MTESKQGHTPGDWQWHDSDIEGCRSLSSSDGEEILRPGHNDSGDSWIDVTDADMQLIAKAPELRKVLAILWDGYGCEQEEEWPEFCERVRKLLDETPGPAEDGK